MQTVFDALNVLTNVERFLGLSGVIHMSLSAFELCGVLIDDGIDLRLYGFKELLNEGTFLWGCRLGTQTLHAGQKARTSVR